MYSSFIITSFLAGFNCDSAKFYLAGTLEFGRGDFMFRHFISADTDMKSRSHGISPSHAVIDESQRFYKKFSFELKTKGVITIIKSINPMALQ